MRTQGEEDFAVNVQPRRGISLGAQGVSNLTKQMFNQGNAIAGKGYNKRNGIESVGQSVSGVSDIEESLNATRQRFYSNQPRVQPRATVKQNVSSPVQSNNFFAGNKDVRLPPTSIINTSSGGAHNSARMNQTFYRAGAGAGGF